MFILMSFLIKCTTAFMSGKYTSKKWKQNEHEMSRKVLKSWKGLKKLEKKSFVLTGENGVGRYFHGCWCFLSQHHRCSFHVVKNEKTLIGKVVSQASDLRASPSSVCLRKEIQFLNFSGKPFQSYDFTVSDSVNKWPISARTYFCVRRDKCREPFRHEKQS